MWEPCNLTIWVPEEDDQPPPRHRSSPSLLNKHSVSTPQYYLIRYPSIGSKTYIQKTYPDRQRRARGTRSSNSNPNPNSDLPPNPSSNPHTSPPLTPPFNPNPPQNQNQNPTPTRNSQSDTQYPQQRVNTSNRRDPTPPARNAGSNVTTPSKATPLKSILKIRCNSGKKVRFADPPTNNMSAPEPQARPPSFSAATRGSSTPRSMPSSPIRSRSPEPEAAQSNSHYRQQSNRHHGPQGNSRHGPQNNMEQWESASNEDDDPTIPRTLHTPQRGTWQFSFPQVLNENSNNTDAGNGGISTNLGRRHGHQPTPIRLDSPPPAYTTRPNSPQPPPRSRAARRANSDRGSSTEDNIDDIGHDHLSGRGIAHAKAAHLKQPHNPDRHPASGRSRRWEYVPIILGRRSRRDTRAWSYRPHISHFPASLENLRNYGRRANRSASNNTNIGTANGEGTNAPQPPPRPTVEDVPEDVQW